MDGIPQSIWRDFPHPSGPNLGGREHVPFTNFEIILAKQILSCSHSMRKSNNMDYRKNCRKDVCLAPIIDGDCLIEEHYHSASYERLLDPVRTSGHKTLEMNDAFVELQVDDDDAFTHSSDSEVVHVQNPSFFSHRATVEDLILSFRKTIGPLAGVEIRNDSAPDSSATPLITISDAISQRSLDCALEKWRVEQEEKELEMRWRATKRVSENWLTKVQLVRERQVARREKFEREREKRKTKPGSSTMVNLTTKGPTASQGSSRGVITNPRPHSSAQPPTAPPHAALAPPHPALVPPHPALAPPHPALAPPHPARHSTNEPTLPRIKAPPFPLAAPPGRANIPSSIQTQSPKQPSPVSPKRPHAQYDPRTPDLALEELAHTPQDSGLPDETTLPETVMDPSVPAGPDKSTVTESMRMQEEIQCVQQYFDMSQISQSPRDSPPQDTMPLMSFSPSLDSTLVPDESSGGSSVTRLPKETLSHHHTSELMYHTPHQSPNLTPLAQDPPDTIPAQGTMPLEPTAEEKMMWHIWSLTQAPLGTAADVILRDPEASHRSNLAPVLFNMFPNFKGNIDETARLKILTGSSTVHEEQHPSTTLYETQSTGTNTDSNSTLSSFPFTTFPLEKVNWSPMLAPRSVIIRSAPFSLSQPPPSLLGSQKVGMQTVPQDKFAPPVTTSGVSASRPRPVLKTQDLLPSLPPSLSHVDSPLSPTSAHTVSTPPCAESNEPLSSPSALYPHYMPIGNRLYRIARLADADVLRPSFWFEPDAMTTVRMQDVINLMEQSGIWSRPERRTRVFRGDRKAHGPDDLAGFDLCFGY